jgi:hypothetical protein
MWLIFFKALTSRPKFFLGGGAILVMNKAPRCMHHRMNHHGDYTHPMPTVRPLGPSPPRSRFFCSGGAISVKMRCVCMRHQLDSRALFAPMFTSRVMIPLCRRFPV